MFNILIKKLLNIYISNLKDLNENCGLSGVKSDVLGK